jgi:8-oxo-dGTP pyrophosphatase MutT (NUDIX family)
MSDAEVAPQYQMFMRCPGFPPFLSPMEILAWFNYAARSRMAHIHEKIDFTVAVFVVQDGMVLVIHHRALNKWLPLGGHIELDEDPEQAALREAREESGLEVELIGKRPPTSGNGTRALIRPRFLDIHRISDTHEHVGMIYWARPKSGTATLAASEHHAIRWCSAQDLDSLQPSMDSAVKWYCNAAITEISNGILRP